MNVNEKLIALEKEIEVPVEQDIYEGCRGEYVTFTYEDEKPAFRGNNHTLAETAYLQVVLCTLQGFNYFELKKKISGYLESQGFIVTSIQSWLTNEKKETKRIRQTVFSVTFTEERERN